MKPSKINVVKAKLTKWLLSSFKAITLFGTIYTKKQAVVDEINRSDEIDSTLKSHETIHVRQAQGMHNSWCLFYLKYGWQWLMNLPLITVRSTAPYKFIPIELEAYANETDYSYCMNGAVYEWKKFKKIPLKRKKAYAKEYYAQKELTFNEFINQIIIPSQLPTPKGRGLDHNH